MYWFGSQCKWVYFRSKNWANNELWLSSNWGHSCIVNRFTLLGLWFLIKIQILMKGLKLKLPIFTVLGSMDVQTGRGSCQDQSFFPDDLSLVNQNKTKNVRLHCLVCTHSCQAIVVWGHAATDTKIYMHGWVCAYACNSSTVQYGEGVGWNWSNPLMAVQCVISSLKRFGSDTFVQWQTVPNWYASVINIPEGMSSTRVKITGAFSCI